MRRMLYGSDCGARYHRDYDDRTGGAGHKTAPTRVTVSVQGLHCQGCIDELQHDLAKIPGVSAVK